MTREIQDIPPAPRTVRWAAVWWHAWPLAVTGLLLILWVGTFTLMLLVAQSRDDEARTALAQASRRVPGTVLEVAPTGTAAPGWDAVRFSAEVDDMKLRGWCQVPAGSLVTGEQVTVRTLDSPLLNGHLPLCIDGGRQAPRSPWRSPGLYFGLLVCPGFFILLLWLQRIYDLRRMMALGDVGVARVTGWRRSRWFLPAMVQVEYSYKDFRARDRTGHHLVPSRSDVGQRIVDGEAVVPILVHRAWPKYSRLCTAKDFLRHDTRSGDPFRETAPKQ